MRQLVIVDIDGTITDASHRIHFVRNVAGRKDWDAFYAALSKDPQRKEVIRDVEMLAKVSDILLITGRAEKYRIPTIVWLRDNDVKFIPAGLLMRPDDDRREDTVVKKELLDRWLEGKEPYDSIIALDDRPRVIRMWKEEGFVTIDVGDGIEF